MPWGLPLVRTGDENLDLQKSCGKVMTNRDFGKLLDEMLTAYIANHPGDSKNKMILRTGIDRSTFFKYLGGSRPITIGHLRAILEKIGLDESDKKVLEQSYEELNQNVAEFHNIEILRQCMKAARKAEFRLTFQSGKDQTPAVQPSGTVSGQNETTIALVSAIRFFAEKGEAIHTFLPLEASEILWENRECAESKQKVEMLFHFPVGTGDDVKAKASRFYDLIPIALAVNCIIHYYYGDDILGQRGMLGVLFPYYVVGSSGIFFMNAYMDSGFFTSDKVTVSAFLEAFQNIFRLTECASDHIPFFKEGQKMVTGMLGEDAGSRKVFIIGRAPCMNLVATRDLLEKVIPPAYQDEAWEYSLTLQNAEPIEIIPEEGLRRLVEEGGLEEEGIRATLSKEEIRQVLTGLRSRLGRTLFIADKSFPVNGKWAFLVRADEAVMLLPYEEDDNTLIIYEKNVLNGFSSALELSLDKITVETPRARKLLDYYIGLAESPSYSTEAAR